MPMTIEIAREKVLSTLPSKSIRLLERVEEKVGWKVNFLRADASDYGLREEDDIPAAGEFYPTSSRILLFTDVICPGQITHELLHFEQIYCLGVPMLEALPSLKSFFLAITGLIEHLVIVPLEADYGFANPEKWNESTLRNWNLFLLEEEPDFVKSWRLIETWLSCNELGSDQAIIDTVTSYLIANDGLSQATKLHSDVMGNLEERPMVVAIICQAMGIDTARLSLQKIDLLTHSYQPVDIPSL